MWEGEHVSFVQSGDSMHVLALHGGEGPNFRLLGVLLDNALSMRDDILEFGRWQLLVFRTPYGCHISRVRHSFLLFRQISRKIFVELRISSEDTPLHFNLAPLMCRRDMHIQKRTSTFPDFFEAVNSTTLSNQSRQQTKQPAAGEHPQSTFHRNITPQCVGINTGIQSNTRSNY